MNSAGMVASASSSKAQCPSARCWPSSASDALAIAGSSWSRLADHCGRDVRRDRSISLSRWANDDHGFRMCATLEREYVSFKTYSVKDLLRFMHNSSCCIAAGADRPLDGGGH